MNCVVTAGPTFEPLDDVRRLTNFSTGRLGSELANFLASRGHQVTLLLGQQATYSGEHHVSQVKTFTTTTNLRERLQAMSKQPVQALFHAAAVSDFSFGKIWRRAASGALTEMKARKLTTRAGVLMAELLPTPKIIAELRDWFPHALIVGWKYEVEGDRAGAVRQAEKQLTECRTDACVANGPAYGAGFGLVRNAGPFGASYAQPPAADGRRQSAVQRGLAKPVPLPEPGAGTHCFHLPNQNALFEELEGLVER
jgi:phosphopantothenoylcysteine decarboxylase/phosphopantothenate--cysteine ligase